MIVDIRSNPPIVCVKIVVIRSSDIKSACNMRLAFNQILNSRGGIMLSSKGVVNICAMIKNRSSLSHMQSC